MQLQFQLSIEDYLAAQRLHSTRSPWPLFISVLTNYIYPIIGFFFLVLSIPLMWSKGSDSSVRVMIICGLILVCLPLYIHFQRRRCYKRTRSDNGECKVTFGEESIGFEGQYSSGEMNWKAVKSFRENKKVFVLYLAPARFLVIPKRVCTDEQIGELHSLFLRLFQSSTH